MTFDTISEENLKVLVHTFYDRVHHHETLGPIFSPILKGRWYIHLAQMVDFWSSVLLASGRYYGHPVRAHMMVQGLKPEHFGVWLELWRDTLDDLICILPTLPTKSTPLPHGWAAECSTPFSSAPSQKAGSLQIRGSCASTSNRPRA